MAICDWCLIVVLVAALLIIPPLFAYRYEKRAYNNGHCTCGAHWVHFDCDSQGGDMWKCLQCGRYLDTSWINRHD